MCYYSEEIWLQQLSKGTEKAYMQLFERYYALLSMFAFRYLADKQLAEDAVHDVVLNLWQRKEKFVSITTLKSYLYNAVRNRCLNILDYNQVRNVYVRKMVEQKTEEFYYLETEVYDKLRDAINTLPEQQRRIFDLTLQGFDNAEIAEKLNISLDAVKSHKKRGKKQLKESLENLMFWSVILNSLFN